MRTPAFIITAFAALACAGDDVNFSKGTYAEALERAASRRVPLFVDFYTDW